MFHFEKKLTIQASLVKRKLAKYLKIIFGKMFEIIIAAIFNRILRHCNQLRRPTGVIRWLDYFPNIWPFTTTKVCPIA